VEPNRGEEEGAADNMEIRLGKLGRRRLMTRHFIGAAEEIS